MIKKKDLDNRLRAIEEATKYNRNLVDSNFQSITEILTGLANYLQVIYRINSETGKIEVVEEKVVVIRMKGKKLKVNKKNKTNGKK